MTDGKKLVHDEDMIIILFEGELVVEHQTCDSCRPKTTILPTAGSHIYILRGTYYRVRNLKMGRARYIEVITNINHSD